MPIVKAIKSLDDVLHRRFGRISILFEVMNGFGFDCQSPVLDALRKAGKVNIGVTTSSLGDEPLVQAHIKRVGYAEYFIAREKAAWRKWDMVVCTDSRGVWYRRNTKAAYLQHGISGRGNYPYTSTAPEKRTGEAFDYFLASSESIARLQPHYFPLLGSQVETFIAGYPKLDRCFATSGSKNSILAGLGLSPDRKTILVASHWDEHSLLKTIGFDVLDKLTGMPEYNVLIGGHPYNWDSEEPLFSQRVDWQEKLSRYHLYPHMRFVSETKHSALLNVADLLVSDHNSMTLEFCALNKPVLRYENPGFQFHDRQLVDLLGDACLVFREADEFPGLLHRVFTTADTRRAAQARLAAYCFSYPGCAADMAAGLILELCRASGENTTGRH